MSRSRSEESRNPLAEHRHQPSTARSDPRSERARTNGNGHSGEEESYDSFSAKVREEIRRVEADMRGGIIGDVGQRNRQSVHSYLPHVPHGPQPPQVGISGVNGDVGHYPRQQTMNFHPPNGQPPPHAGLSGAQAGQASRTAAAASPKVTQTGRYHDDRAIQNSIEKRKPRHLYHDSKGTQVNLLHEIQNDQNEKRRVGEEFYKVQMLERELAAKDSEIAKLHSERRGEEHVHRIARDQTKLLEGRKEDLEQKNKDLEQKNKDLMQKSKDLVQKNKDLVKKIKDLEQELAEGDSDVAELTRQLQSAEEATHGTIKSEKDLAQSYARDLNNLESDYEHALAGAVRENEILQNELTSSQEEIGELQKEIGELHDQLASRQEEISELQDQLAPKQEKIDELEDLLASKQEMTDELQNQINKLQDQTEEIHVLRIDNKMLNSENEKLKEMAHYAEEVHVLRDDNMQLDKMLKNETEKLKKMENYAEEVHVLRDDNMQLDRMLQSESEKLKKMEHYAEEVHKLRNDNKQLDRMLKSESEKLKEVAHYADEVHVLRNDNKQLKNEKERLQDAADNAHRSADMRQRKIEEMELEYEDSVRVKNCLKAAAADLKELEADYEILMKEKMRLETVATELEKLRMDHEVVVRENKRLEVTVEDEKKNYHHLLEEKARHERESRDMENELYRLREDYDVEKERLLLLDEMTEALEVALDEKQNALAEKGDAIVGYNQLQDEYRILQSTLENTKESMRAEYRILQSTLDSMRAENRILQSTLDSAKESMKQELNLSKESMKREQESIKQSMKRELNAAHARTEDAVAQYKDLVREHEALTKEHAKLQSTKDSSNHVTEMVTRQRDKMTSMVEKYQDEIDGLKRANRDLRGQRDDLKEELICVLETASVYQD
eukprot:CAMPEP_0172573874 /NCGR_PEP_ID=MMETSP1067-20121228/136416_1 /TAXON_ID=265564 ORGANISM="Thalassiosira punctigera, Strain Tpunct2005C2" /NCGR_SAMPLE_ID=MMETSP1067 /ASSEMBLY_ACC=CAM_ASM_000444 /LENGTH=897 /DNA_ID=CAMNT_0013366495 /DNA_START=465 /DNA_END=3158 /DNA_ORIENTATION=+